MKLWCYRDRSGWGATLAALAETRGHDVRLFAEAHEPDDGAAFVHMHHHPETRDYDKELMAALAARDGLHLCPSPRSAALYDDKAEQFRQIGRWMPKTLLLTNSSEVAHAIAQLRIPLISKTAEGAGSNNVRLIETVAEAAAEAEAAFVGRGIPCRYGQRQRGYLLWQEFLLGNAFDFRVIAIGRERLILRRGNREDRPMASGSGFEMPVTWPDAEASDVLDFANRFFAEEGFSWCGIDVLRDHRRGCWTICEMTAGWPLGKMHEHVFVSGRPGGEYWPMVLDEIEAGTVFS